ncbi:Uncharacterized protein FWK35_00019377 [Aphis craccivora]|uniref:Uncharacterized protein n=1 Tax=Aphis craccivora TaxID=307492 RepID=A0A6G0YB98_APHCR|nr:Uncharacterized protein FWK35_00019377 [Aphis craccivora]
MPVRYKCNVKFRDFNINDNKYNTINFNLLCYSINTIKKISKKLIKHSLKNIACPSSFLVCFETKPGPASQLLPIHLQSILALYFSNTYTFDMPVPKCKVASCPSAGTVKLRVLNLNPMIFANIYDFDEFLITYEEFRIKFSKNTNLNNWRNFHLSINSSKKITNIEIVFSHFLNFPIVFKSVVKNQKKIKEKQEFLRKTSFRLNRFFYMVVIQKLITVNT